MADYTALRGNRSKSRIFLILFTAIAAIALIVGIVLIALAIKKKGETDNEASSTSTSPAASSFCDYSEEAKRIRLEEIIMRAKKTYYEKHPFMLPEDPDASREEIKKKYTSYNPTPDYIKSVTDAAWSLYNEVKEIKVDSKKLKPRERKALSQLKHYLKTVFGQPFDMNFYAGDWMMGPTFYCHPRQQVICNLGAHLQGLLRSLKPENLQDIELIEEKLKTHKKGILRYIENLKMGKLHGMVHSQDACEAGRNALRNRFLEIALKNETGLFYFLIYNEVWECSFLQTKNIFRRLDFIACTFCFFSFRQRLHFCQNDPSEAELRFVSITNKEKFILKLVSADQEYCLCKTAAVS